MSRKRGLYIGSASTTYRCHVKIGTAKTLQVNMNRPRSATDYYGTPHSMSLLYFQTDNH